MNTPLAIPFLLNAQLSFESMVGETVVTPPNNTSCFACEPGELRAAEAKTVYRSLIKRGGAADRPPTESTFIVCVYIYTYYYHYYTYD